MARHVVNSLVIGRLETGASKAISMIAETKPVNSFTKTFILRSANPIPGVKLYHKSIATIGKHYLVNNILSPNVKRHYTVTNCMNKGTYQEYLRVIKEFQEKGVVSSMAQDYFDEADSTDIAITVKNYRRKNGLSTNLFSSVEAEYEV